MPPKPFDEVRVQADRMVGCLFQSTCNTVGEIALPSLAQGLLDAISRELVERFGEARAYEIFSVCADSIINDSAAARLYLSAICTQIGESVKRAKGL